MIPYGKAENHLLYLSSNNCYRYLIMAVLITGGAGFIGSHLIEHFLHNTEYDIKCLDNFNNYYDPLVKKANIQPLLTNPRFTLIKGDIRDGTLIKNVIKDVEYIFHEAAQAGVRISIQNPQNTHDINASGTLNLLCAAIDADVKKFINASSSSVYGHVNYLPFDEKHPTFPVSPYGVSKLMAEHYCRVFQELHGLKTCSLRYFTVYGPRMRPDLAIHIFTRNALRGEPITIFGDGKKTRDFTYVDDVVNANILAMEKGIGEYNIGGGHHISIQELAEEIIRINASASGIHYEKPVKGDAEHTFANTKKAKTELDWYPKVTLEEGLKRYAEWVRISQ